VSSVSDARFLCLLVQRAHVVGPFFLFRDSFANVVDLLDDMFERAAQADEPIEMNFIKKHAEELIEDGVTERAAARLFSNP